MYAWEHGGRSALGHGWEKNWEWRGPPGRQHRLLPGSQVAPADVSGKELFYLCSLGQDPHGHLQAHCQWTWCPSLQTFAELPNCLIFPPLNGLNCITPPNIEWVFATQPHLWGKSKALYVGEVERENIAPLQMLILIKFMEIESIQSFQKHVYSIKSLLEESLLTSPTWLMAGMLGWKGSKWTLGWQMWADIKWSKLDPNLSP